MRALGENPTFHHREFSARWVERDCERTLATYRGLFGESFPADGHTATVCAELAASEAGQSG